MYRIKEVHANTKQGDRWKEVKQTFVQLQKKKKETIRSTYNKIYKIVSKAAKDESIPLPILLDAMKHNILHPTPSLPTSNRKNPTPVNKSKKSANNRIRSKRNTKSNVPSPVNINKNNKPNISHSTITPLDSSKVSTKVMITPTDSETKLRSLRAKLGIQTSTNKKFQKEISKKDGIIRRKEDMIKKKDLQIADLTKIIKHLEKKQEQENPITEEAKLKKSLSHVATFLEKHLQNFESENIQTNTTTSTSAQLDETTFHYLRNIFKNVAQLPQFRPSPKHILVPTNRGPWNNYYQQPQVTKADSDRRIQQVLNLVEEFVDRFPILPVEIVKCFARQLSPTELANLSFIQIGQHILSKEDNWKLMLSVPEMSFLGYDTFTRALKDLSHSTAVLYTSQTLSIFQILTKLDSRKVHFLRLFIKKPTIRDIGDAKIKEFRLRLQSDVREIIIQQIEMLYLGNKLINPPNMPSSQIRIIIKADKDVASTKATVTVDNQPKCNASERGRIMDMFDVKILFISF